MYEQGSTLNELQSPEVPRAPGAFRAPSAPEVFRSPGVFRMPEVFGASEEFGTTIVSGAHEQYLERLEHLEGPEYFDCLAYLERGNQERRRTLSQEFRL